MKIALIRKKYNYSGGAENYLRLAAGRLKERGHDVHILTAGDVPDSFFKVNKIKSLNKPSFLSNILFAINVNRVLKNKFFDCVISFERLPFKGICRIREKARRGLSNVVYRAGDGCHKEWLNKRKKAEPFYKKLTFALNPHHIVLLYFEKLCFSDSGLIIANSKMVKNDILKHYLIPDEKIHVLYNGVDLQRFQPVGTKQKEDLKNFSRIKENHVILFAGGDFKRKGLDVLLKAVALLDIKDVKLIVAGRGDTARYSLLAGQLGIEKNVLFRGAEQEMEKLYGVSDVFVLPTIYDPFSNATLEAMASGVPVITTSFNGASELIENGVQGFVIDDPLNESLFAENISTVLRKTAEMGRLARIKAEEYPIDRAVDEILKVIF